MTPNTIFTKFLPIAAAMAAAGAFAGCSTVSSISPFQSTVPYSQDVQPTMAKPAVSEIPAFQAQAATPAKPAPAPEPPAPPSQRRRPPHLRLLPRHQPPSAPAPAPAAPAPAPAAAPQSFRFAGPPRRRPRSRWLSRPPRSPTRPPRRQTAAPETAAADTGEPDVATEAGKRPLPSIPEDRRAFKDDGNYPNLARFRLAP